MSDDLKTYHLTCMVTVSANTVVRARSREEAIRVASGREVTHSQNADDDWEWWTTNTDGTPEEIQVEFVDDASDPNDDGDLDEDDEVDDDE